MPHPQIEDGHLDIANEIVEKLMKTQLSGYEWRYLWALWRKTWCWKKKEDWISWTQLEKMTGKSRMSIGTAIKKLVKKNILVKKTTLGKCNIISLNKHFNTWNILVKKTIPVKKTIHTSKENYTRLVKKTIPTKETVLKETITKENIINNTETKVSEYGNPNINKIISFLKEKLGLPILDGSEKANRQYAQLLLNKSKKDLEGILGLISLASEDDWYKNNITSVKDLYYNAAKIVARKRGKTNATTIADFTQKSNDTSE